ncbi:MAG: peptidoglycan DD-metalloendopeptidase family protein [Massilia sp.]
MSSPKLLINVQPSEAGSVVYLTLAPRTSGAAQYGHLALKLSIKNNEAKPVVVSSLTVSFIGPPTVPSVSFAVMVGVEKPVSKQVEQKPLTIAAGATGSWFFQPANNITLPVPGPSQIRLAIACEGFNEVQAVTLPLKPHQSPVAGGSYDFPAKARDFRIGEYWSGRGESHASAGDGSQLFAYDMGVVAFDANSSKWSELLPGTDGSRNEHYRIWGKPVYAMADGSVLAFKNDMPANTRMGLQRPTPDPVEGNHFWLQHGDEAVLYAHMQAGSLNPDLASIGAPVKRGDLLGLAGNSGNSTNPHLHVHAIEGSAPWAGPLRPLPFRNLFVIDRAALSAPSPSGPWVKAEDQGLPGVPVALWPGPTVPAWYPPGWGEVTRSGIPEAAYQAEFDRVTSSGYRPVWVDAYEVNGRVFFNAIFHPEDGTAWTAHHGMNASQYQAEFTSRASQGFQLIHIESYISGKEIRYASIFAKKIGGPVAAYHGVSKEQHQQKFNMLTAEGWRPINISVVSPNNVLNYCALYQKRDVGAFFARSFLTPAEYQVQFNENNKAGRKLSYLNAYTHLGQPHFSAIWFEKTPAVVARHGENPAQFQLEFDRQMAAGLRTRVLTGYEEAEGHRFGATWS